MRHLLIDDRGQDLVEYVLLGATIAFSSLTAMSGVRGAWRGMAGGSGRSSGYTGTFGASDAGHATASMAEHKESLDTTATSFDSSAMTKLAARLLNWSTHARSRRARG